MKLLPWVVLGLLCWVAWRLMVVSRRRRERRADDRAQDPAGAAVPPDRAGEPRVEGPERMVQCGTCGVHLPASEGVFAAGKVYCSEAHRRAHDARASSASRPDAEA